MNQLRKAGTVDAALLRDELEAALGAAGTPQRWYLSTAPGEATVAFDDPILPAAVQAVLDAHAPTAAKLQDLGARSALSAVDRLQFDVLFNHENRVRALEAKAPVTAQQFKDALIARWKVLNP